MHKSIPIILAILALFVLSLCGACVSQPAANQSSGQNAGLTQLNSTIEASRISFEEAQQKLNDYEANVKNESANEKSIYSILAKDVDESGNATSWVFGIGQGSEAKFLVYDKTGWTEFPWSTPLKEKIAVDQIISPRTLFSGNKAVIVTNPSQTVPERRDLELKQGTYMLTIYSGSANRILTFNATTGTLIA
jgi:hypothetical protein